MLTGSFFEVETHPTNREELKAAVTDVVKCRGGDFPPPSRGKEHLLLQAADVDSHFVLWVGGT